MNLCKDCKHCNSEAFMAVPETWTCESPINIGGKNPLDGTTMKKYQFCVTLRNQESCCGLDAKWFEPKEPQ